MNLSFGVFDSAGLLVASEFILACKQIDTSGKQKTHQMCLLEGVAPEQNVSAPCFP